MKPFPAWLAMMTTADRLRRYGEFGDCYGLKSEKKAIDPSAVPKPVLIVPDTEENRRKLGMEE